MSKYAEINTGIVVNIIECDASFAAERGFVAVPEVPEIDLEMPNTENRPVNVNIGDSYIDGNFVPQDYSAQEWANMRQLRDNLLKETDIFLIPDRFAELTEEQQAALVEYRQKLRDIPQNYSNVYRVQFPEDWKK
jgi:hypothetical protein